MRHGQVVLVACTLSRSAFSGERVFRVKSADDQTEHVGIAPTRHCFLPTDPPVPIGPEDPPKGQRIDGLVEGFLVENGGDTAEVVLPDRESITVRVGQIQYREAERARYVPL